MDSPITKEEIAAFVGDNADYYRTQWTPLMEGKKGTRFNWVAFLFGGFWLPYRKMYKPALILYVVICLEVILEETRFKEVKPFGNFIFLIIGLILGAFGNRLYFNHATAAITQVRSK